MPKKILIFLFISSLFISSSSIKANTVKFDDADSTSYYVENAGTGRDAGFEADLYFPDGGDSSLYTYDIFEFDDYYSTSSITDFTITLAGHGLNNSHSIEIYLNLKPEWGWQLITSYNVDQYQTFTLTLDILNQQLLYDNSYAKDIDYAMSNFVGIDSFNVGYGCHFWHDSTSVSVAGSYSEPIPEPVTCVTLFIGIVGLLIKHRKNRI